jgi:hypothetical protein
MQPVLQLCSFLFLSAIAQHGQVPHIPAADHLQLPLLQLLHPEQVLLYLSDIVTFTVKDGK